jgi:hypothetical protein
MCVISETHWNIDLDHSFIQDTLWSENHVNYQDSADTNTPPVSTRQDGVALLFPPASPIAATRLKAWHEERVTAATWRLECPTWLHPIYLSAVYRAPRDSHSNDQTATDVRILLDILTQQYPDGPHIAAGDFNAHTAGNSKGPHALHLPPRRSDARPTNLFGQALLGLLQPINWIIATNRIVASTTHYSRALVIKDPHNPLRLVDQRSCLDYFLTHVDNWSSIASEAILALSGASLGTSDHNLCLLDFTMQTAPPSQHPQQAVQFLPLPHRPTFNLHALATNVHTTASRQGRGPLPPPQVLYTQALATTLPAWTTSARIHLNARPNPTNPQALGFQPTLDTIYASLTGHLAQALHMAVGLAPLQPVPPHTTNHPPAHASAASLHTLCQAHAASLASLTNAIAYERVYPTDPAVVTYRRQMEQHYAISSKKLAAGQRKADLVSFQCHVNTHVIRSAQQAYAWKLLKAVVHPPERGVPSLVKDAAGNLILSQMRSAHRWHEARTYTSRDWSCEPMFHTSHLQQLAAEDQRLAALHLHAGSRHP